VNFISRRAFHALFLLFCVSAAALALVKLTPGDFFESMRIDPQISPATLAAMRSEEGLDRPLPILYWRWLESSAKGEWGFSFAYNEPAGPILRPRIRNTVLLGLCAMLLAWAIAWPAGIIGAVKVGKWADLTISAATFVLLAIPELVLALLLLLISAHLSSVFDSRAWLALESRDRSWADGWNLFKRMFPPSLCIAAGVLPVLISHIRAAIIETLRSPFITAARSFGISSGRILVRHVLPAASNPLLSLGGLSIGLLVSSSLVVEAVFNWPGLGQLMLQAIADRDIFLIVDAAVLAAGFLVLGNFASDVLLYLSDPRIRAK
jgi:peptide/nickel transport system permease protein